MFTGNNGLLSKTTQTIEDTIIAQEKEQISLAWNAVVLDKTTGSVDSNISEDQIAGKLEEELKKNGNDTKVEYITEGENNYYKVTFEKNNHTYSVDLNGTIEIITDIAENKQVPGEDDITVTFDANGGTVNKSSIILAHNSTYGELPTPTREGYTFFGWSNNQNKSVIPDEYQAVEFIESTGSQYILTSVLPTNTTGVYAKLSSSDLSNGLTYFGSNGSNSKSVFYFCNDSSQKVYFGFNETTSNASRPIITLNEINDVELNYLNSRKQKFNNTTINITSSLGINNKPLALFAYNGNGSIGYKSKAKLYELKISEGNLITHNLVPCYRKSDNVIGMYDNIDRVFHTNSGSGTFGYGSNVDYITSSTQVIINEDHTLYAVWGHNPTVAFDANGGTVNKSSITLAYNSTYGELPTPTREGYRFLGWSTTNYNNFLPNGYQEVEYIESMGAQYIYTKLPVQQNDEFETKSSTTITGDYKTIISAKDGFELYYNLPRARTWQNISILSGQTTNINSGEAYIHRSKVTANAQNLEIFSYNKSYNLSGKIYYVKWFRNGNIINNFVPCYRRSDNVTGMYDVVNDKFYKNNGSDSFIKGSNINYIADNTKVITNENHTLYAIWKEN